MKQGREDLRRRRKPEAAPKRRERTGPRAPVLPEATRALPFGLGAAALAALAWSLRNGMPGVAVADDYSFLARLAFERPLELWSSMGATYYWRPLSRQAWFSMLGWASLAAPWLVALVHTALLALTAGLIYRTARRGFGRWPAAAIALIPLVSQPARALVAWPSGIQHLLAATLVALAVHESAAARWVTAAIAAAGAVLSHESGALALVALPFVALLRARAGRGSGRTVLAVGAVAAALGVAWLAAYRTAIAHGVVMPPGSPLEGLARLPDLMRRAFGAALNLEDQPRAIATVLVVGHLVVLGLAAWRARDARHREALARRGGVALALVLAFTVAIVPLAQLLPDWNDWRAWTPTLALGAGVAIALAALDPRLALAFAGLKLVAVLTQPPAAEVVTKVAAPTASHMSYLRLTRLQRIVSSTRRALARVHPELPPQAAVRYWNQQRLAEVGFQDHAALRVWYGDSTLIWTRFGGTAGLAQQVDALVEYVDRSPDPAFAIEPAAVDFFLSGARTFQAQRYREADTLFARGLEATTTRGPMYVTLLLNRARSHLAVGELDAAMAFNDQALRAGGEAPDYYAIQARIFAVSGRREEAVRAVERILRMEPENREGLELAQRLGMTGP